MKNKISIYTKTGDKGETTRFGGEKLSKAERLFECLGDLDELNCVIGLCKEHATDNDLKDDLKNIQNQLFDIGAYIASPKDKKLPLPISQIDIQNLEDEIDNSQEKLRH